MIWVLLWVFIGLATATWWVYIDVTQEDKAYNLKELSGMTLVSAFVGPFLIGLFIYDRYSEQIVKFFNKPIVGGEK